MRFWDSSALVPLCVEEPATERVRGSLEEDPEMTAWWGSAVECWSAFARLRREGVISAEGEEQARAVLERLGAAWTEILPSDEVRTRAGRLVRVHPLRAADAFQLSAALTLGRPELVSFDDRLRTAARLEGLRIHPGA